MIVENLLELESYFGRSEAIKTIDELIAQFGAPAVYDAVRDHYIELRPLPCRVYACLTEHARYCCFKTLSD